MSGFGESLAVRASDVVSRVPILAKPFTPAHIASAVRELIGEASARPRVA